MWRISSMLNYSIVLVITSAFCWAFPAAHGQAVKAHENAVQSTTFLGTHWRLTELAGQPLARGSETSYLTFDRGYERLNVSIGTMHVRDSCNKYMGSYVARGASLEITPQTATLVACLVGSPDHQRGPSLFQVLGFVSRFEIQGQMLVLRGKRGVVLARLDAVDHN